MVTRREAGANLDDQPTAVWALVIDGGARHEPQVRLFWHEAEAIEAASQRGVRAGEHLIVERLAIVGNQFFEGDLDQRPRCRACREPIELDDPDEQDSWVHCRDAMDLGSHTAER